MSKPQQMAKYTNFRIIYLNFNIIYLILSLFLFYKCTFSKLIEDLKDEQHQKLYALGIITTIQAVIVSYIGCLAIWFRSKAWTQMQILFNLLLIPFLVLAYIVERFRRGPNEQHDPLCEYAMLALFAFGSSLIFLAIKFLGVLRTEFKATPREPLNGINKVCINPVIYDISSAVPSNLPSTSV